jgi:hypothetical protein
MNLPPEVTSALDGGWSILPVGLDKKPKIDSWKCFQDVPAPPGTVERWQLELNPPAWAVITGAVSGVIVVDFDGDGGQELLQRLGLKPHVRTGSGGAHLYVKHPGWPVPTLNGKTKRSLGAAFPGLDIRADGGYAVFCGRSEFGEYRWLRDPVPDSLDVLPLDLRRALSLAEPPIASRIKNASSAPTNLRRVERVDPDLLVQKALEQVQAGEGRNNAGFWLACQLRDNSYSLPEAGAVIRDFASRVPPTNTKGQPEAYTEKDALASMEQAFGRPARDAWGQSQAPEKPEISVLEGLADRARESSMALDAPGVIEAMAWLFAKEPAKYDDLRRKLRKVDVGNRAYEPRVQHAAKKYLRCPEGIDPSILEKPSEVAGEKFGAFTRWRSEHGDYLIVCAKAFRIDHDRYGNESYIRIANFAARVVEETALDDGADVTRFFTIDGMLSTGLSLLPSRVPVTKYQSLSWPTEVWGLGPSIAAGLGAKDHMRAAIDEFSGTSVPRRTVFIHLGWRKIGGKGWVFLHAGGAVDATDVDVDVEAELQKFLLPVEPGNALEAVSLTLCILELGDPKITFPLWAIIWRAPLCEWLPFLLILWLLGETGSLKSTLAALILCSYGGPFDKDSLPASWLDTENRLEQKAFLAKDCPIVVDDFCPEKHAGSAQDLERRASRLIRAVGNRQARGRLRSDLTARKSYIPRGVVVSTAEQLPSLGVSALARILPIPFEKGMIDKAKLSELQAKAHLLPYAIRAYLQHLAPQGDDLRDTLRRRFEELRGKARVEGHDRLPESVAHMFIGFEMGIAFAVKVGAIGEERAQELLSQGWITFVALAKDHAKILQEERPTRVFIGALQEALVSGRAWLADRSTGKVSSGSSGQGAEKIGWVDGEGIYLLPDTAFAFATERLRYRGGVALSERALRTMLHKDNLLLRGDEERLTTKKRCEGTSTSVLWLRRDALGELPGPEARQPHCHRCDSVLSSEKNDQCPTCGWLVCSHCGCCKPECGRERS